MANEPRQSQGVVNVRWERSDFPQWGWIRKPTGTLFDTPAIQNWQIPTVSTPKGVSWTERLLLYTDFPQWGWIRKPTGNLFDRPDQQDWHIDTVQTPRGVSYAERRLLYTDFPQQGWIGKPNLTLYEPGKADSWSYQPHTFRMAPGRVYVRDTNQPDPDGWVPYVTLERDHGIPSDRTRENKKYWRDTNLDVDWISATFPAGYDPAVNDWHIDTIRTNTPVRWPQTNVDVAWASVFLAGIAADAWTIDSQRPANRLARPSLTDSDLGWISTTFPQAFDPQTLVHWSDERMGRRWRPHIPAEQPRIDWIYPYAAFDPQFLALWNDVRMRDRMERTPQFKGIYYRDVMDLSWVHDVIPLTDPLIPSDVLIYRGGDDAPRRRKKRQERRRETEDIYKQLERTIHQLVHGIPDETAVAVEEPPVVAPNYGQALEALLQRASEFQDLSQQVHSLRQLFSQYEAARQQALLRDDDEMMLWL